MRTLKHPKIVRASALEKSSASGEVVIPTTDVLGKPMLGGRTDPGWEAMSLSQRDDLLRRKRFWRLGEEEFQAFKGECELRGFSILCQHLHPYMEWDSEAQKNQLRLYVHIGALRVIANRDPKFEGYTRPRVLYSGKDETWHETWQSEKEPFPAFAKVGVYVKGHREPVEFIARWDECAIYIDGPHGRVLNKTWTDRGVSMLAKCAEAGALRIACPETMSGLYLDKEEMDKVRADAEPIKAPEDQRPTVQEDNFEEDELPIVESPEALVSAMVDAGYHTKEQQEQVKADARGKYQTNKRGGEPMLIRLVMRDMLAKVRAGV